MSILHVKRFRTMDSALQESCWQPSAHPIQPGDHWFVEESAVLHHAHQQVHTFISPSLCQAVPCLWLWLLKAAGASGGSATCPAGRCSEHRSTVLFTSPNWFFLSFYIMCISVFLFLWPQILGMGTKRLLTLTHRAQVKRFTQDLLKLLKFQASKQVAIKDFMQAYHWSVNIGLSSYSLCIL